MIFIRNWYWRGWRINFIFHPATDSSVKDLAPILLLHGFGASVGYWRNNIAILGQKRLVYAIDLLGFGASEKVFTQYKVSFWEEMIFDFWKTFIGSPIVLIGNSLGSLISLSLAAHQPEVVCKLVLLNIPDPGSRSANISPFIFALTRSLENLVANSCLVRPIFYFLRRRQTIRFIANFAYFNHAVIDEQLIEILCAPAYSDDAVRTFLSLVRFAADANFAPKVNDLIKKISLPTLLIWGKKDKVVPITLASKFLQKAPNIEFIALEKVGHCPHDEEPELINKIVLKWLSGKY
jgi:haloalkane dehalogenase